MDYGLIKFGLVGMAASFALFFGGSKNVREAQRTGHILKPSRNLGIFGRKYFTETDNPKAYKICLWYSKASCVIGILLFFASIAFIGKGVTT